jgi:hypothetical protein
MGGSVEGVLRKREKPKNYDKYQVRGETISADQAIY